MSKPVRLPDYLAAEIETLAAQEKRSLANMVTVLLEQALKMDVDAQPRDVAARTISSGAAVGELAESGAARIDLRREPERAAPDHFKPDFKK